LTPFQYTKSGSVSKVFWWCLSLKKQTNQLKKENPKKKQTNKQKTPQKIPKYPSMENHEPYDVMTAVLFPLFSPDNKKCSLRIFITDAKTISE